MRGILFLCCALVCAPAFGQSISLSPSVVQLRGDATGRQVDGARVALAHLVGGGSICTVNLLEGID